MHNNFTSAVQQRVQRDPTATGLRFIQVSLLIGEYFDGAKIHNRKASNFWPLFINILSIPPHWRNKAGIGMFLIAIFKGVYGSVAERFTLDCIAQEIRILGGGVFFNVSENVEVFIQARVLLHSYDSKALEKVLNVMSSNSRNGCFFCTRVISKRLCGKQTYGGHRRFLPINHELRYFGVNNEYNCCPAVWNESTKEIDAQLAQDIKDHWKKATRGTKTLIKNQYLRL